MAKKRKKKKRPAKSGMGRLVLIFLFTVLVIFVLYGVFRVMQYKEIESGIDMPRSEIQNTKDAQQNVKTKKKNAPEKNNIIYKNLEIPVKISQEKKKEQVIAHKGYTVSYNQEWKIPNWVGYELLRSELDGNQKRSDNFMPDPEVNGASAANHDYTRSGFDRGHMAPAGDMKWDKQTMQESFYFSNICPQNPDLNSGAWRLLEEQIRTWAKKDSAVIVVCGPIVNPDRKLKKIGRSGVVVPSSFFKVVLVPYGKNPKAIGFIFKNSDTTKPIRDFAVSVDSVETVTGLDFFAPLPDDMEKRMEATVTFDDWSWRKSR